MRQILALFFIVIFSQAAVANQLCGPKPSVSNSDLDTEILKAATGLAQSDIRGQKLLDQATNDFIRFKKKSGDVATTVIGEAYFHQACKITLGSETQVTSANIEKLEIVAKALDNPPAAQEALDRLKAAQNIQSVQSHRGIQKPEANEISGQNKDSEKPALGFRKFSMPEKPQENTGQGQNVAVQAGEKKATQGQSSECADIGEIGECSNLENTIKKLKQANLKYNHPDTMYLKRKTLISLVIETTGEDQTKAFEDYSGKVQSGKTKISRFMEATLTGQDFDIEPSGPIRKTLTSLAPVKWTWYVTPRAEGTKKRLNLELSAVLRDGNRDLPPVTIRTFAAKIDVNVRWWDRLISRVEAFDPIYQLGAAIGGVASALLLLWRFMVVIGRRRRG